MATSKKAAAKKAAAKKAAPGKPAPKKKTAPRNLVNDLMQGISPGSRRAGKK